METFPCNHCPDRKPLCHSVCKRYRDFRKAREAVYEKRQQKALVDAYEARRARIVANYRKQQITDNTKK